jgi:hypothetical protein
MNFYLRTVIFVCRGYSTNPSDPYFIHMPLTLYILVLLVINGVIK